jgi:hypothetical protein
LVEQRATFDCVTACLATIFGVTYEDAPILCDFETGKSVERWHRVHDDWLHARGFASYERMDGIDASDPMRCPWSYPGLWIGGVYSPRHEGETHAVVCRGNDLIFDPHPQRDMGHRGWCSAEYFMPIDPAMLVLVRMGWGE